MRRERAIQDWGTSRPAGELEDVHSGAGAPRVKHDAVEDFVALSSRSRGATGLLGSPGSRGCLGEAEEGLCSGGPVPLYVDDIDEQAHEQAQRVRHLRHPQAPTSGNFPHGSVGHGRAGENAGKTQPLVRFQGYQCSGTKQLNRTGLHFLPQNRGSFDPPNESEECDASWRRETEAYLFIYLVVFTVLGPDQAVFTAHSGW